MLIKYVPALLLAATLAGCNREDHEAVHKKLMEAGRELRHDAREASRDIKKGSRELKEDLRAK